MRLAALCALGLAIALEGGAALGTAPPDQSELPDCTFQSCLICLISKRSPQPGALAPLSVLTDDGAYVQAPLRIGRSLSSWDAESVFAQIVGILVQERLGLQVDYVRCEDEVMCFMAVNNCLGWHDYMCDQADLTGIPTTAYPAGKLMKDPLADIMFAPTLLFASTRASVFNGTQLDWEQRPSVLLGPTGFTAMDGLYVYPEVVSQAWADSELDLLWLRNYRSPQALKYFASPAMIRAAGVRAEVLGCSSSNPTVQAGMVSHRAIGWICNESWSWWLNPACARFGSDWVSRCVVTFDDDWGYLKPGLYKALAASEAPIAKLHLGYDLWEELLQGGVYNVTFTWWFPDATLQSRGVRRVSVLPEVEPDPEVLLKGAWTPALQASPRLSTLLSETHMQTSQMRDLMATVATAKSQGHYSMESAPAFYQKIACDWLRANADTWTDWLPSASSCLQGQIFNPRTQQCVLCPEGTHFSTFRNGSQYCHPCSPGTFTAREGLLLCAQCPAGSYQPEAGQDGCMKCPPGTSQASAGQTACADCQPGRASTAAGASECFTCGPGTSSRKGATICVVCATGTYADSAGLPACASCGGQLTTMGRGAVNRSECICIENAYRAAAPGTAGEPVCLPCKEGMYCAAGSDATIISSLALLPGYMSRIKEPLKVYKCAFPEHCPGPLSGTCAERRDTEAVACGKCLPGSYEQNHICHECRNSDRALSTGVICCAIVLLIASSVANQGDFHRKTQMSLNATTMLAIAFTLAQTLCIFVQLEMHWFFPLDVALTALSFLSFDLEKLKVSCLLQLQPAHSFGVRQGIPLFSVPVVVFALLMKKAIRWETQVIVEFVNAEGTVFQIFFISILLSCSAPLVCYDHPDGNGMSVSNYPSVLCYASAEHRWMVITAVVSCILVPLPFLSLACYCVRKYPSHVARAGDRSLVWLRTFQFMFFRYRSECYYYGLVVLVRSLLVCLAPAVIPHLGVQICAICALLLAFTMGQTWLRPWRSELTNLLDGALSNGLVILLICGIVDSNIRAESKAVQVLGTSIIAALAVLGCLGLLYALSKYMRAQTRYEFFLCHHKADAQAQARLLKIRLQAETGKNVFIDSDDLAQLDRLFDIVKYQVSNLIVVLTRHTLTRGWCVAEITTAYKCKVNVIALKCTGFVEPTAGEMQNLETYVDATGCNLAEAGMSLPEVQQALVKLLSTGTPVVQMPTGTSGLGRFEDMLVELLSTWSPSSRGAVQVVESRPIHWVRQDMLVVSSQPGSDEALASAAVLVSMMKQQNAMSFIQSGLVCAADYEDADAATIVAMRARAVMVLLSADSLVSNEQLTLIINVMEIVDQANGQKGGAPAVIPVTLPGFIFPGDNYFEHILPNIWPDETRNRVKLLFRTIALPFSTDGSAEVLSTQAKQLLSRVPVFPRMTSNNRLLTRSMTQDVALCLAELEASEDDEDSTKSTDGLEEAENRISNVSHVSHVSAFRPDRPSSTDELEVMQMVRALRTSASTSPREGSGQRVLEKMASNLNLIRLQHSRTPRSSDFSMMASVGMMRYDPGAESVPVGPDASLIIRSGRQSEPLAEARKRSKKGVPAADMVDATVSVALQAPLPEPTARRPRAAAPLRSRLGRAAQSPPSPRVVLESLPRPSFRPRRRPSSAPPPAPPPSREPWPDLPPSAWRCRSYDVKLERSDIHVLPMALSLSWAE